MSDLGPNQLAYARSKWSAFRDLERTSARLRREWEDSVRGVQWPIEKDIPEESEWTVRTARGEEAA